ncbi:hypothetical protein J6590_026388 [Homalodisca vitripennis]|nr:hypothetical protein J6590_026388 [Homalodisca vitripennis]
MDKISSPGTLRVSQRPQEVTNQSLKADKKIARYASGVVFGKKKDCLYISSEHENNMVDFVGKRGHTKPKSLLIVHMSGVNHTFQIIAYHPFERNTLRGNKKFFARTIQVMLMNAHQLHKGHCMIFDWKTFTSSPRVVESPVEKRVRKEAHKEKFKNRRQTSTIPRERSACSAQK